MKSAILGCQVRVQCENISPCIEVAESLLAAMESFFSTALVRQVVAHEPLLSISVRRSAYADAPFSFRMIEAEGRPQLLVLCRDFSTHDLSQAEQTVIQQRLTDRSTLFARVFCREPRSGPDDAPR
jgi:hypothetical protein